MGLSKEWEASHGVKVAGFPVLLINIHKSKCVRGTHMPRREEL